MKPNPEQDADRSAFEKWRLFAGYSTIGHPAADRAWQAWQAATTRYQDVLREVRGLVKVLALTDSPSMRVNLGTDIIEKINKLLGVQE